MGDVCGPYCNVGTNGRGLRLLEFAIFNNLVQANANHPEDGHDAAQMGNIITRFINILVKKRFRLVINIHRTRSRLEQT